MSVMCNKSKTCKWGKENGCGGTKPHERCPECGKCHYDKKADCVEIDIPEDTNNIRS